MRSRDGTGISKIWCVNGYRIEGCSGLARLLVVTYRMPTSVDSQSFVEGVRGIHDTRLHLHTPLDRFLLWIDFIAFSSASMIMMRVAPCAVLWVYECMHACKDIAILGEDFCMS